MGVVVFDNLPDALEFQWRGELAGKLASSTNFGNGVALQRSLGQPQRAIDLYKDPRNRHLRYAPDFFKFCEAKFDFAIFYVADPKLPGVSSPVSVWQAAGAWIGARGRHAPDYARKDERVDGIIFSEGPPISNLFGYLIVNSIDSGWNAERTLPDWLACITKKVYEYVSTGQGALNEPNLRVQKLAERLGLASTDELKFSGYEQSRRPCKLRYSAIDFFESSRDMVIASTVLGHLASTSDKLLSAIVSGAFASPSSEVRVNVEIGQIKCYVNDLLRLTKKDRRSLIEVLLKDGSCPLARLERGIELIGRMLDGERNLDLQELGDALSNVSVGAAFVCNEFGRVVNGLGLSSQHGTTLHAAFVERAGKAKIDNFL